MSQTPPMPAAQPGPPFNFKLAMGLLGILLAAMISGLNSRIAGLVSADIQGALSLSQDAARWLDTFYAAGEISAMPFASWFAITYSLRRFHLTMLTCVMVLAAIMPFIQNYELLLGFRLLQGVFSGALIPVLMMAALRFLPPPIRLHGLALYAMTATLSPNVAVWLAAFIVDDLQDWRWVYWHVIPLGIIAFGLVRWGMPQLPQALGRLKQANWFAMVIGIPGLIFTIFAIAQGRHLDWFQSNEFTAMLILGLGFTALFLISEWFHPAPFIKLQLLGKKNLGIGFIVFILMLVAMTAAVGLPINLMMGLHHFRMEQVVPLGLIVGVPQIFAGSIVAILLYRQWVDARYLFILGLACMAASCFLASNITPSWTVEQFYLIQSLQAIGQPLSVVSMLFLGTSSVHPMEGPFVSGIINTLRAFGTAVASALIGQLMQTRGSYHSTVLAEQAAQLADSPGISHLANTSQVVQQQAAVMAGSDVYFVFGCLTVALIPVVMYLNYTPAPKLPQ